MVKVRPSGRRSRVVDEGGILRIIIPARRNIIIILLLGFWLVGWVIGEIMVPLTFFRGDTPNSSLTFVIAWLGVWIVVRLFVTYVFAVAYHLGGGLNP